MPVAPLEGLAGSPPERFGGKAASLGEMLRNGVKALDGVAVSVDAYERALELTGAAELTEAFWQQEWSPHSTNHRLEELSAEIERRLATADVSVLADAVLARLADAGISGPELIVRSSATGEDSARLSYAGQFDSRRCGMDRSEIEAAIVSVWTSCTSPHVVAYRSIVATATAPIPPPGMGVVIQPYCRFALAGLAFTQHPTATVRGWMLLEYLDEQPARLVAGELLPHVCRVNVESHHVVWERRVAERPVLSDPCLADLVGGAIELRRLAATEVDIEWGMRDEKICFLQSRPATTRPDEH